MAEGSATKPSKKTRSAKPVYAVMSVANGDGPAITKEDVTIHNVYKNSDDLLDRLEGGGLPEGTFYKRLALS